VLRQTIAAAEVCWRPECTRTPPCVTRAPYVFAAFAQIGSAVELLGHCLGRSDTKACLDEGLRFLGTLPCSLAAVPMPVQELQIARTFTAHGAVHGGQGFMVSERLWRRVMEPLETAPQVFWAAGRQDDDRRFTAFAKAPVTWVQVIGGEPGPVFVRDIYAHLTRVGS